MAVFASRQIDIVIPVAVTITGSGNSTKCYSIINGTTQYSAGTHEVNTGDTITFGIYGARSPAYGLVTINGTQVLKVTNGRTKTYDWTVPSGISTIKIVLRYAYNGRNSTITVTTA